MYSCFSVPSTAASTSNPEENEEISGTGEGEKSEVGDGGSIVESKAGSRISSAKVSHSLCFIYYVSLLKLFRAL